MVQIQKVLLSIISISLLLSFFGIFPIETVSASDIIITVDDSGGANYTTIQAAIDSASSGDAIYVYSGTYNENIEITTDLILTGQNRDTTIIDSSTSGHVLYAHGTSGNEITVDISGFKIQGATGVGFDCIALSYVDDSSIENNIIINSENSDGIQLDHSDGNTLYNNQITNNEGVGISLTLSTNNIIYSNVIQNNQRGIYVYLTSNSNQIYSNTIGANSQYGIYIQQSSSNLFYLNDFTNNGQHAKDSLTNSWSYNNQGNYWDDYNDYDSDENGIGDTPHDIPGGSNQDDFPLGYFLEPEPPGGENQVPTAHNPNINPNPATDEETVTFTGSGTDDGYIDSYNWRSDRDGQLSIESEFSTADISIGVHTIYFKVKDNEGVWSTEKTATLTIYEVGQDPPDPDPDVNNEPIAIIDSVTPNPAEYLTEVTLSGHGTDVDGEITEWKWESALGETLGTEAIITISDLSIGTHTIYFKVRDNENDWSRQVTESLEISLYPYNEPPLAKPGGIYTGKVGVEVIVDGSQSSDEDGEITEYLWDFGDESTNTGSTTTHIYTTPGEFEITLTVTDDDGDSSSETTTITITQSGSQSSGSSGSSDALLELPTSIIILICAIIVICGMSLFGLWIKFR